VAQGQTPDQPPRNLTGSVALVAGAMLVVELVLTRLFSVLFFYHYSFFAVSLIMSGLSLGAILASRWSVGSMAAQAFQARLSLLSIVFAVLTAAGLGYLVFGPGLNDYWVAGADKAGQPSMIHVAGVALVFLPGLVAAGAFLASAFARRGTWIGRLYSADLAAAALACMGAIGIMRVLPGPLALLPPVGLAALAALVAAPRSRSGMLGGALLAMTAAFVVLTAMSGPGVLAWGADDRRPDVELWNEHSRVVVYKRPNAHEVIIDKSAGTAILPVAKRPRGAPLPVRKSWDASTAYLAYKLGRPLNEVAIIGVGGGRDLLAPLANKARHVDGYEVNGLLLDLLRGPFAEYSGLASWPEVSLIKAEARVGISLSGKRYDAIQASLIDTWAATASGGLVLSENTLYTEESWLAFLRAMTPAGLLTFTRWYTPIAPAETQRLVSLGAVALRQAGLEHPSRHVLLVASGPAPRNAREAGSIRLSTIIISMTPFTSDELARARSALKTLGGHVIAAPDQPSRDPTINQLMKPKLWARAVASSPYDLSPPTDSRPYFFLPVRLQDIPGLVGKQIGATFEVTFNAMRVLFILAGFALLFAVAVFLAGIFSLPSTNTTPEGRRLFRWMNLYFMGIGLGYIMIQLGLHQVAIVVLGHPTFALSVVLFSMLLGSGLGAALSSRVQTPARFRMVWLLVTLMAALLLAAIPALVNLGHAAPLGLRVVGAAILLGTVGCGLGFVLPIGVRLVSGTGEWAVQKVWAVNGAATILGAVLAALIGLSSGSHTVLASGLVCYLAVLAVGIKVLKLKPA